MHHNMKVPNMPSWLEEMPKKAQLCVEDICGIFGYTAATLYDSVARGYFPASTGRFTSGLSKKKHKCYWEAYTVRNEIRRRKALTLAAA